MANNYLATINAHERDKYITFQEEGHKYTVDGKTDYTSVTTWIHSLFQNFDSDRVIENMMKSKNWPNNKYFGKTKQEIKAIWDCNRDTAASAGTKLHYDIECKYNGLEVENDSVEYNYFLRFYEDYLDSLTAYRTEMLVFHEELKLSGSIDMLFKLKDGTYEIYDWKRCKEIVKYSKFDKWIISDSVSHIPDTNYWHYALQLNTYKYILIHKYNMNVGNLYLVVLHPENKSYLRIQIPNLTTEINQLFAERINKLSI